MEVPTLKFILRLNFPNLQFFCIAKSVSIAREILRFSKINSSLTFILECDECSEALLDRIFPETDKVTQTMTQLNNVITSKLTQTKFDTLAQGEDDIKRSISLINEGMDLYNNHDAKMSFLQKDICGKDGELEHWISVFMATKAAFNKTIQGTVQTRENLNFL